MRAAAALMVLVAATGPLSAETRAPLWDHLPVVAYRGDEVTVSWPADGATQPPWNVHCGGRELAPRRGDDGRSWTVTARVDTDRASDDLTWSRAHEAVTVRLIAPGCAQGIALDHDRRLAIAGSPVVLVLPRVEADVDRRWKILGVAAAAEAIRCQAVLLEAEPVDATPRSGILGLVVTSQALPMANRSLLVLLPASDIHAGWQHRTYRQLVAWLVADAIRRGANQVVLAGPFTARAHASDAAPLRRQVADVASAYHCRSIDLGDLGDERYWQIAPGILGPGLNDFGRAKLAEVLAPWRADLTP